MKKTVTFDFDGTLSTLKVQQYARELIARGIDVWVVTRRYDNLHIHNYNDISEHNIDNADLYAVLDAVGIPRWKVHFTNMEYKANFFINTNVIWHLDDDPFELFHIRNLSAQIKPIGIQVNSDDWRQKCEKLLTNLDDQN